VNTVAEIIAIYQYYHIAVVDKSFL